MPKKALKEPRSQRGVIAPALLWVATPLLVMLVVWQQASVEHLVVNLEQAKDERTKLESEVNALRLEADRLSSLGQVETRAERELGMVRPETQQLVDLVFQGQEPSGSGFPWVREASAGTLEDVGTQ